MASNETTAPTMAVNGDVSANQTSSAATSTGALSLFSLAGKTAVVTGAARGIGQAMAIALAEAGADVILVQRDESKQDTRQAIERLGRRATIYSADLGDAAAVRRIIPDLVAAGHRMDILLNCAGVQKRHPAHEFPDDDFAWVMQVNLNTVFTLCRDFGAYLLSRPRTAGPGQQRGTIINIASLLTFQGGINVPAYAASKGGVGQLTKALSNQWAGDGITVNAIAPGYIATEMNTALINDAERNKALLARIPAGRWGTPDDFKGPVVFLASPAGAYVTGEVLTVDGGWMAR